MSQARRWAEVLLGWRLFGQGATPESETFHALTYDRLSRYTGPADQQPLTVSVINGQAVRGFPTGLDIMAGLGSAPARSILTQTHDDAYEGYSDQLTTASRRLKAATYQPTALSTLQLRLLGTLLDAAPHRAPLTALNTALGSWIQHRHALLLYAKQSYTAAEKSLRRDPVREAALIEPADLLYSVLIDDSVPDKPDAGVVRPPGHAHRFSGNAEPALRESGPETGSGRPGGSGDCLCE